MNLKTRAKNNSWFFYDFVKVTGLIPGLLYFRPKTVFLHKETKHIKGRALIIANHNSFVDPIVLMLSFPFRRLMFMATKDLFEKKLANWFFTHVHCIKVDKDNFNMSSFRGVSDGLCSNKLVAIFPEGSVDTQSEELHPFKAGAVLMALKNSAPIVPVYISKGEKFRKQTVIVGDPIDVVSMCNGNQTMNNIQKINEYLHKKELELKDMFEKGETIK